MYQAKSLAKKIANKLDFSKAEGVIIYDVSNRTPLAHYYIVCSADNARKLNGLKEVACEVIESAVGGDVGHIEGRQGSSWFVIDAHDIVVHIFDENERQRVNFDKIYASCPTVEY